MPKLEVDNGFCKCIPSLGKVKPFPKLSQKTVTKCVRETPRGKYGDVETRVECHAEFKGGIWMGNCGIQGEPHIYKIYP